MNIQQEFPEWMITKALAAFLQKDGRRAAWFFDLKATTLGGSHSLSELCGFKWQEDEVKGAAESVLTMDDRGAAIPEEDFRRRFWGRTPDFRYWTEGRTKQLIVEAKGTPKPSKTDSQQAKRYFDYLREFPAKGAVIYFVPDPDNWNWLKWLEQTAQECQIVESCQINFGVVNSKTEILPKVAPELVRVVGNALVRTADLLEEALQAEGPL